MKVRAKRLGISVFLTITNLILGLMVAMTSSIRVSVYHCNSLDVITDMMVVFISSHNKIFLSFLKAEISYGFSTFSTYVYIGKIFSGLAIVALLVSETW